MVKVALTVKKCHATNKLLFFKHIRNQFGQTTGLFLDALHGTSLQGQAGLICLTETRLKRLISFYACFS